MTVRLVRFFVEGAFIFITEYNTLPHVNCSNHSWSLICETIISSLKVVASIFGYFTMATLTRQDLNFGQGKLQFICKFIARHSCQKTTLWVFWLYWSFTVVADILCEFLEVAIHLILYVREVYPSGIFQKRKKYNVPVQVMFSRLMIALYCICTSMLFGNLIAWFSTRALLWLFSMQ